VSGVERLKVATCQFAVSDAVASNAAQIRKLIGEAADNEADVVHFPEGALSGYRRRRACAGADGFDWELLRAETQGILDLARKRRIWVILGSCHYVSPAEKPTNCLYVISRTGRIVERYDKLMLYKRELGLHTAGQRLVTATINGVRCGFMVCYDSCFPAVYEAYRKRKVQVLFHSLHHADNPGGANCVDGLLAAQFRTRALDYGMWIIASNSSARHCRLASCVVKPDGAMLSLRRHVPGILYHQFPDEILGWKYDYLQPTAGPNGVPHIGPTSTHPRALDPTALP